MSPNLPVIIDRKKTKRILSQTSWGLGSGKKDGMGLKKTKVHSSNACFLSRSEG